MRANDFLLLSSRAVVPWSRANTLIPVRNAVLRHGDAARAILAERATSIRNLEFLGAVSNDPPVKRQTATKLPRFASRKGLHQRSGTGRATPLIQARPCGDEETRHARRS